MTAEPKSGCPTCGWADGFHDREIHDKLVIDAQHFKVKDWQKQHDTTTE